MTATPSKNYLFLYREKGESLVIGEGDNKVVMTIESVKDQRVKIGFHGAREVSIQRAERFVKSQG